MFRVLVVFIILGFYNSAHPSTKEKIISKIEQTKNLSFNFIQTIDEKTEEGTCIIKYSKKIYCEYDNLKKKIMVSNGKSLVITNKDNEAYYIYPLKKTPLEFLLNKDYFFSSSSASGIGFFVLSDFDPKFLYGSFICSSFKFLDAFDSFSTPL